MGPAIYHFQYLVYDNVMQVPFPEVKDCESQNTLKEMNGFAGLASRNLNHMGLPFGFFQSIYQGSAMLCKNCTIRENQNTALAEAQIGQVGGEISEGAKPDGVGAVRQIHKQGLHKSVFQDRRRPQHAIKCA